jgi:tripartite-type tricarboxylate transporter receptor subunit TctC
LPRNAAAGFKVLHVPYKGGAQGVASVVAGETDFVLTPAPADGKSPSSGPWVVTSAPRDQR